MPSLSTPASAPNERVQASLQERKQAFARNAIWEAAIELFLVKGFNETTVDEIVERAGTSRRSFFRYFESKNDLLAQSVVDWGHALTTAIHACPVSTSAFALLREVTEKVVGESASDPRSRQLMEIAARYPAARDAQLSRVAEVQDRLLQAFASRYKDRLTASMLAGLLVSVIGTVHTDWFERQENDISTSVERVFASLSKTICDSNRKRPSASVLSRRAQ